MEQTRRRAKELTSVPSAQVTDPLKNHGVETDIERICALSAKVCIEHSKENEKYVPISSRLRA
jgi:hypothetical protein